MLLRAVVMVLVGEFLLLMFNYMDVCRLDIIYYWFMNNENKNVSMCSQIRSLYTSLIRLNLLLAQ